MKIKLFVIAGIFLLTSHLLAMTATAQDRNPALDEIITVRLGPFLANFDATINAKGHDFKIDEGITTDDVDFAMYGLWRITPRWRVEAGYSGINKTSSDLLNNDIDLGLLTIPAGVSLDGEQDSFGAVPLSATAWHLYSVVSFFSLC